MLLTLRTTVHCREEAKEQKEIIKKKVISLSRAIKLPWRCDARRRMWGNKVEEEEMSLKGKKLTFQENASQVLYRFPSLFDWFHTFFLIANAETANKTGVAKLRRAGQIRPTKTFCPARGVHFSVLGTHICCNNVTCSHWFLKLWPEGPERNFKWPGDKKNVTENLVNKALSAMTNQALPVMPPQGSTRNSQRTKNCAM